MLKKYEETQVFKIQPSTLLKNWLIFLHLLAITAVFLTALSLNFQLIICVSILISAVFYLMGNKNIITIRHSTLAGWECLDLGNAFSPIEVLPTTVISTFLIVLHFSVQKLQKKTIIICIDSLSKDEYRRLLVTLKIDGIN